MKGNNLLFLSILIIFFNYSAQRYLSLKDYSTSKFNIIDDSWIDLLGKKVQCPNGGVIKNFVLRKNGRQFWYDYQCYSSDKWEVDDGEPIIKYHTLTKTLHNEVEVKSSIGKLDGVNFSCWVDYGINGFEMIKDSNKKFRAITYCEGLKSKETYLGIKTNKVKKKEKSMEPLVDVRVGPTFSENDANIAYVLKSFKYDVSTSFWSSNAEVRYIYDYTILRNMRSVAQNYKASFERLRKGNNQKI